MEIQYKIIGGDGREYGPIALEELQSWIRDGRVGGVTQVWRSDLATWAKAITYDELAVALGSIPAPISVVAEEPLPYVGFWARAAAFILDVIVISIVSYPVWLVVAKAAGLVEPPQPQMLPGMDPSAYSSEFMEYVRKMMPILMVQTLIQTVVHVTYEVLLNGRYGATLGKFAIGARIVRLDDTPIDYWVAFLRALSRIVSTLPCYIGYLFVPFRQDKRALHDLMVGTKVVYKR